jgi:hypothetical protein
MTPILEDENRVEDIAIARLEQKQKQRDALRLNEKNQLACGFCGDTGYKRDGHNFKFHNVHSVAQHETWCLKNPNSRRTKGNNKTSFSVGELKIFSVNDLRTFIDMAEKLQLSREQILNLIKLKIGDI